MRFRLSQVLTGLTSQHAPNNFPKTAHSQHSDVRSLSGSQESALGMTNLHMEILDHATGKGDAAWVVEMDGALSPVSSGIGITTCSRVPFFPE